MVQRSIDGSYYTVTVHGRYYGPCATYEDAAALFARLLVGRVA